MTQSELTTRYRANLPSNNVVSIEAKKRCQILRDIEFKNELISLGLSQEDVKEQINLSSITPKQE
ncbi:hypothetical protein MK852_19505 [Shewanella benthica]|nr:hypothetical protein [Shewanella benthica]